MRTINYSKLPKGLSRNIGLNVYEGKKYVYILTIARYAGEEDKLWVANLNEFHRYHVITMGDQLNEQDIKEIAEEAHCSVESVRNEVSVSAAQQYIEYNEPDATYMNY